MFWEWKELVKVGQNTRSVEQGVVFSERSVWLADWNSLNFDKSGQLSTSVYYKYFEAFRQVDLPSD